MQTKRILLFTVSMVLGVALGLAYGWLVKPLFAVEVTPDRLRVDYQADYVLMVAETYAKDQDIRRSAEQLAGLGNRPVLRYVQQAILTATDVGHSAHDIELLARLSEGLQDWLLSPAGGAS